MILRKLDELRPKIRALETMPAVPAILQPLAGLLQMPVEHVDIERVIELVSRDGTITARCLRMANSPFFGRRKTETVRGAIMALGIKRVEAIILGICLDRLVPPDRWVFDPVLFWRHSLGCALVSRKLAERIGYPDPEKAYLSGLLHDLGVLVNTLVCTPEFRRCIAIAQSTRLPLQRCEAEVLGFTHAQSGKILAEFWQFSPDVLAAIEFHHEVEASPNARSLVSLVHFSDLLCRLRDLGYGYYEALGVDLAREAAWTILVDEYPSLANIDLARLSMDIDGAMDEIIAVVDSVFGKQRAPGQS